MTLDKSPTEKARGGGCDSVTLWTYVTVQLLITVFYLGMEWLFFATKASFMDSFSSVEMFGTFLIPPVALNLVLFPALVILKVLDRRTPRLHLPSAVSSFLLASSLFLLIDNFLYTVFGVGVVTSGRLLRLSFLVLFLYLLVRSFGWSRSLARLWNGRRPSHPVRFLPAVLVIGALISTSAEVFTTDFSRAVPELTAVGEETRHPNIILLSSDGIEARLMSVYGFHFQTTPFLESFAARSVVFENAFSNAGKTTGTLSSMLSGSLPSELHVGFPPHIFPKEHAVLHLPAALQRLGYKGYQRSVRYYADAGDLNMISSFNIANGRRLLTPSPGSLLGRTAYLFSAEIQFLTRIGNRLAERLLHVFGIKPIINHYLLVKEGAGLSREVDRQSVEDALTFAKAQAGPYFMQVHLMGSHCCNYSGARRWFDPATMPALSAKAREFQVGYLNAIRDADHLIQMFVEQLEATGQLENSIVIISSDHSQRWDSVHRVPLIVYFPGELHQGRVERNVSLAQVPATVLEFMGFEMPGWMTQGSLMGVRSPRGALEAAVTVAGDPPILSLAKFDYSRFKLQGGALSRIDKPGPPLFGVREVGVILGSHWKKLDLKSGKIESGTVSHHTSPSAPSLVPSDSEVRDYIVDHLGHNGFTLPAWFLDDQAAFLTMP